MVVVAASLLAAASAGAQGTTLAPAQASRTGWIDRVWFDRVPLSVRNRVDREPRPFGSWWTTLALGGTAAAGRVLWTGPEEPRWTGGMLFDDSVRETLRADTETGRRRADDWSDVLVAGLWTQLVVETALVRGRAEQAELWRINLDAAFLSFASNGLAKFGFGRERPNGRNARSFPSGHATDAATAAGLICAHHLGGDLYGGGWGDRVACGAAALGAIGSGLLRISADHHYATDVIAGLASGFVLGYLLPRRWYYEGGASPGPDAGLLPMLGRDAVGLVYVRRF